jgi:hypothetical protein
MNSCARVFICLSVASFARAGDAPMYDADPAHSWNRLSAALHSDAPLKFEQRGEFEGRLLSGESYDATLKALDDFVTQHREKLIADPVKRALLQSDLWATFDQLSDATGEQQPARREIARRCAVVIERLALTDAQIAALPDPYALTVKSKAFPVAFDPAHTTNHFLPDDLLGDGRPWIILSGPSQEILQPAAIQHVKATQGRSVFYALVRLPGGRDATIAYLRQLATFPQPYVWNDMYKVYPYARSAVNFNPALPQFPAGTQVALIRRMVLVNARGAPVVTPIVQSIQLRVYVKDPKSAELGESANQAFFEFQLAPDDLFKGGSGLRASDLRERQGHLTFERATLFSQGNNCNNCHGDVGVLSLNTYTRAFGAIPNTPWFEPSNEETQDRNTINWKKRDYTWGVLSTLLQSNQ